MQIQYLSQAVTPELREWILAQAQAGCASDDILKAMHASGWDDAVARAALAQTLQPAAARPQAALPQLQAVPAGDGSPVPEPDLRGAPLGAAPARPRGAGAADACSARAWCCSAASCPTTNATR